MPWTETSSGEDAFNHVFAHMKSGPMKGVDHNQCPGFQLWRRFLRQKPGATLGECLSEFEHMQRKQGNAAWPLILLEALGDADDTVRSRIIKTAEGDAALNIMSSRAKLSKDERETLRERRHKGRVRLGKAAPPEARQPGRKRKDG